MNLSKILLKRKLPGLVSPRFVFFICALGFISLIALSSLRRGGPFQPISNTIHGYAVPLRLKIPRINVDSYIEHVGITSEGKVDVPSGPESAAWFNLGPRPGEIGTAVIDGHAGYKNNRPAVFDNLYKLRIGDKLFVEDSDGATITFIVRQLERYKPDVNAPDVFGASDEKAHLNLITCTGLWDNTEKTHSDRLVVFTDKE